MQSIKLEMIDEIQCPGCLHGLNTNHCAKFELNETNDFHNCKNWHPATCMSGIGRIALGLPKGFCRTGSVEFGNNPFVYIRLYEKPEDMPTYDKFNIPVWAMVKDGYLYVRCYSPRTNWLYVDVIKDGKLERASFEGHKAIDVGEFYEEID